MIALMNLLLGILEIIIKEFVTITIDALSSLIPSKRKEKYTAHFIEASKVLFKSHKGFCLTGDRSLSIEDSFLNFLLIAPSGAGKTSVIGIPTILRMAGASSLVIHDCSGELYEKTSGALAHQGYRVQQLNYSQPHLSERYNPLERAKTSSDIKQISQIVVHAALGQSKDPFWNTSAEQIISFFARYLVYYAPSQYRTLGNVLHLLNTFSGNPEQVDQLIAKTNDSSLITEYKAWVAYGDKTLMSIIATARAALGIFSDESVAMVTAADTIDFSSFRVEKQALYITNSVPLMKYYSVISAIFFEQFFGQIMGRICDKDALPIFFILDEAAILSLRGILPTAISNIRKYNSGILQIYQHYNQIVDIYGSAQARNIATNCYAKVYMSPQPIEIAQELETTLGKFTFDDDGIQRTRPLMTADEIRQCKDSIILCGNNPPILAKMKPYYSQPSLKKLTEIPPAQPSHSFSQSPPPLIQFD